jgi:hypothetical protein
VVTFQVEPLAPRHVEEIVQAFAAVSWPGKNADLYHHYLTEQDDGTRSVLVASADAHFLGYVTVMWSSGYLPFREARIPEIVDLTPGPGARARPDHSWGTGPPG